MKTTHIMAAATLVASAALAMNLASAQQFDANGIARTETVRHDIGDVAHEAVQVRVDFAPGAAFPRHTHPGTEIAYVLQGTMEYQLNNQPPVTLKAGDSLFIPEGAAHSAKNVGSGNASELATYVVAKGKPIVVIDK
jgi:quercetin dioxygenase-like cupin family protein